MSDETKKQVNELGSAGFKIIMVLLGFFASAFIYDMRETMHDLKANQEKVTDVVSNTRETVIGHQRDIENHDKRIEKLERHTR